MPARKASWTRRATGRSRASLPHRGPRRDPVKAFEFRLQNFASVVQVGDRHEVFERDRGGVPGRPDPRLGEPPGPRGLPAGARRGLLQGHQGRAFHEGGGGRAVKPGLRRHRHQHPRGGGDSRLGGRAGRSRPGGPPSPAETDSLRAFAREGGSLLVFLDPSSPVALDSVLAPAGIRFVPRFLADPSRQDPQVIIPAQYSDRPATRSLRRQLTRWRFGRGGSAAGKRDAARAPPGRVAPIGAPDGAGRGLHSAPYSRGLAEAAEWRGPAGGAGWWWSGTPISPPRTCSTCWGTGTCSWPRCSGWPSGRT